MKTMMNYDNAEDWIIKEEGFDSSLLGKCESIMSLGNGYLGLRSATEESYLEEHRGLFVAGTFHTCDKIEVTEIPNAADLIGMNFWINGTRFSLEHGKLLSYERALHLKNGELRREIVWESLQGTQVSLRFQRFVSFLDLHLIAQKITITPLNKEITCRIQSGIDGRVNNCGAQHFIDGEKQVYKEHNIQYVQKTTGDHLPFVLTTANTFFKNGEKLLRKGKVGMDRRQVYCNYELQIEENTSIVIEKLSNVFTGNDRENTGLTVDEMQKKALAHLNGCEGLGYDKLFEQSKKAFEEKVWKQAEIIIHSTDFMDQLAIRFVQYHLAIMTPKHDNRYSIGAKGLSGEGYKGHIFWTTDIFILPYFLFHFPEIGRRLEEYRYLNLSGAHRKASENHYQGAQYPWESAGYDQGEVTPQKGNVGVRSGAPQIINTGIAELHITADVAYGIWQYYEVTSDEEFMNRYGYEIIIESAKFWVSRLEYDAIDQKYHLRRVIGPDEYKEYIHDNAYTNYMVYWNLTKAMECYQHLKELDSEVFGQLNQHNELDSWYYRFVECKEKLYVPRPDKGGIIAQDATYLTLPEIDLFKYRRQSYPLGIYEDYDIKQITQMQVSKQADTLLMLHLLEHYLKLDNKKSNWDFYEPRTLHDASVSFSIHCILACDIQNERKAYEYFKSACNVDLGPYMESSDDGIDAASLGGIWRCIVYGFAGILVLNEVLQIQPYLPRHWKLLELPLRFQGEKLNVKITRNTISVHNETGKKAISVEINGKSYQILNKAKIKYQTTQKEE